MNYQAIMLLSGGLDSSVVAYFVKKKLKVDRALILFFDYGQNALKEEEYCCKKIADSFGYDFKKINLKWLGDISTALLNKESSDKELDQEEIIPWWVPCRNSIFILNALAHAESNHLNGGDKSVVYLGIKDEGENPMKDTTPSFLAKINELAEEATHHGGYEVEAPILNMGKDETVKLAKEMGVPLEMTYSCYMRNGFKEVRGKKIPVHCGKCKNCKQRKGAFHWSNIKDPSIYREE